MRVGWVWGLLEVAPGVYNQTYLAGLRHTVRTLAAAGIRSILDMHQDVWSGLYCGEHGVPEFYAYPDSPLNASSPFVKWGAKAFPQPVAPVHGYLPDDAFSAPFGLVDGPTCDAASKGVAGWASVYATHAVGAAVQRFYDNADGYLDAFIRMWVHVYRFFAAEGDDVSLLALEVWPYILPSRPHLSLHFVTVFRACAYTFPQIMNEPWVGDFLARPELILPGVADKLNLRAFWDRVFGALRSAGATRTILFWEPATGGNILGALPVGLPESPGGAAFANMTACSFHVYCPMLETDMSPTSNPVLQAVYAYVCDNILNPFQYGVREADIKRLGGGGMLTEFGSVTEDQFGLDVLNVALTAMDAHWRSWSYWLLTPATSDNATAAFGSQELARTYPRLVAGTPISFVFDNATAAAHLVWRPPTETSSPAFALPTEVYVNARWWYPRGVVAEATPAAAVTIVHDAARQLLLVSHTPSAAGLPQISLRISAL